MLNQHGNETTCSPNVQELEPRFPTSDCSSLRGRIELLSGSSKLPSSIAKLCSLMVNPDHHGLLTELFLSVLVIDLIIPLYLFYSISKIGDTIVLFSGYKLPSNRCSGLGGSRVHCPWGL